MYFLLLFRGFRRCTDSFPKGENTNLIGALPLAHRRLEEGQHYKSVDELAEDLALMFDNAQTYNEEGCVIDEKVHFACMCKIEEPQLTANLRWRYYGIVC